MNQNKKLEELFAMYLRWPLYLAAALIVVACITLGIDKIAGLVVLLLTICILAGLFWLYFSSKKNILKAMVGFAKRENSTEGRLTQDLDVPYALSDEKGVWIWKNNAFEALVAADRVERSSVTGMFPDITVETLKNIVTREDFHSSYLEEKYHVYIQREEIDETPIFAIYLMNETELVQLKDEVENEELVVGLLYLDNYEEAMESVEEVRRSLLIALVDRKLNQYFSAFNGIVKKLEKDKYFFVIKRSCLRKMEERKFELLEDIKTINIGNEMNVTASIGIGASGQGYSESNEYARMAMDMALGRGGDQAVVRDGEQYRYFGGKSQAIEKTTRVKARVKAHALRELLEGKDHVIIMGHKIMDIDCFGSAIGVWRIAQTMRKKAHIVSGEINSSLKPFRDRFLNDEYPKDLFIDKDQIKEMVDDSTMLVVVDVNRPSLTEQPDLLSLVKTIVVLDHHRQSSEIITNAVLSYVEPYASSACEMVSEIVQYIRDDIKLKPAEVDAMYAGMVIDTHSFTQQTGVRTFEAAAFLRRKGADVIRVRKLFRDKIENYMAKNDTIHNAEIVAGAFAFSECKGDNLESSTVVAAQSANDLLDIVGVKASFVFTMHNGIVFVSGRSIDEVNVQMILERLGGGGHRNVAGAQFKDETVDEVRSKVKNLVLDMLKKGELTE